MSRLGELRAFLSARASGGVAVAFSGGVDSSLLLAVLADLRDESPFPLLAVTMHSIFQGDCELAGAERVAAGFRVDLKIIGFDPLAMPEIEYNPPDRCYWCKKRIFSEIGGWAEARGLGIVIDGTNFDDLAVYRPGRRALRELGIVSPLAELRITKVEVRSMAAELGIECASKPSSPCLATRFEYGVRLVPEQIRMVAEGEALLHAIVPEAVNLRLRVHGGIARIEVDKEWFNVLAVRHEAAAAGLKKLGFKYVTLDLNGFRSGGMDMDLTDGVREKFRTE